MSYLQRVLESIQADTAQDLIQSSPRWDDLMVHAGSVFRPGLGTDPSFLTWFGVLQLLEYDIGNIGYFIVQAPHRYKLATNLRCHIHWTPHTRGVIEDGKTVNWRVDLNVTNINDVAIAPVTFDLTDVCDGVDHKHQIASATAELDLTGGGSFAAGGISMMIVGRIYRLAGDTWTTNTAGNRPALFQMDFHFENDTIGSSQEFIK